MHIDRRTKRMRAENTATKAVYRDCEFSSSSKREKCRTLGSRTNMSGRFSLHLFIVFGKGKFVKTGLLVTSRYWTLVDYQLRGL